MLAPQDVSYMSEYSPLAGLSDSWDGTQFSLDTGVKPFHPYNFYPFSLLTLGLSNHISITQEIPNLKVVEQNVNPAALHILYALLYRSNSERYAMLTRKTRIGNDAYSNFGRVNVNVET